MTVNSKAKRMQLLLTIREMPIAGHSYNDIIAQLGGQISDRTFWRYVKRIFQQDIRNLQRTTDEQMMRQVAIHVERCNTIYRKLESIAADTTINAEYRLNALSDMFKLSRGLIDT